MISVHARVRKLFPKTGILLERGSRRGATPGRLGAQNRWFLTRFRPEGRLHRTRGWDCPGAHFAYDMRQAWYCMPGQTSAILCVG